MLLTPAAKISINRRYPGGGAGRSPGKSSFRQDWRRPFPAGQRRVGPRPRTAGGRPGGAGRGRAPPSHRSAGRCDSPPPSDTPSTAAPTPVPAPTRPARVPGGSDYLGTPGRAAEGAAPRGGAEGSPRGARRRLLEPFPRWAAGEGMSADSLCLQSGGSGEGRRRRLEATVQGSAGGEQGGRCACP